LTIPLLAPDALGGAIPSNDPYETNFTTGQRNIFRQAWQRRMDVSFVKNTSVIERMNLKFRFDVCNITNPPSFDVPIPVLPRLPHGWNTCIAHSLRRLEHGLLQLPLWFRQREQDHRQRSPDSVLCSPRLLRVGPVL
jgi:hypothetical protein